MNVIFLPPRRKRETHLTRRGKTEGFTTSPHPVVVQAQPTPASRHSYTCKKTPIIIVYTLRRKIAA